MFDLFIEGGVGFMSALTLTLVLVFLAAWKTPAWMKELGAIALTIGIFSLLLGLRQMFEAIQEMGGDVPFTVICGGLKVALIPVLYSLIIYFISLLLRIVRKPRFFRTFC